MKGSVIFLKNQIHHLLMTCMCELYTCRGSTRTVQSWDQPPETSADTGWHSSPCWFFPQAVPPCDASSLEKEKKKETKINMHIAN